MTTLAAVIAVAKAVEAVGLFLATPAGQRLVEEGIKDADKFEARMQRLFPKLFKED